MQYYLAVYIGSSSGQHILGWMENGKIKIEEVYRFENNPHVIDGVLCWDIENLFSNVVAGIKRCAGIGKIPATMGIDT